MALTAGKTWDIHADDVVRKLLWCYFSLEHQKYHEKHKGHEQMHAEMFLILLGTLVLAHIALTIWKKRHFRSYQVNSVSTDVNIGIAGGKKMRSVLSVAYQSSCRFPQRIALALREVVTFLPP